MSEAADILHDMQSLADDAQTATAGDPITIAHINAIASGADNFVEAEDGFARIAFDGDVGDAAFTLSYDSTTNVMTLRNLTSGEIESVDIGDEAIAQDATQTVLFEALGAEIGLNDAFDKSSAISDDGGVVSSGIGAASPLSSSIKILEATGLAGGDLTTNVVGFDVTTANAAVLTIGDFSVGGSYTSDGIDLSTPGIKVSTLSNGADAFTIEFYLPTAYSDTDHSHVAIRGLGTILYGEASFGEAADLSTSTAESPIRSFASVDAVLNGLDDGANGLQAADGFESFTFAGTAESGIFLVSYDAAFGTLKVRDLSNGLVQAVAIDKGTPIAPATTQTVVFNALDLTVVLNDAFDKSTDIAEEGASFSATGGGNFLESSFELVSGAHGPYPATLQSDVLSLEATAANATRLNLGGFSASGVDLSTTGVKSATLSDGTDAFTIEFQVTTAFSDSDSAEITLPQLGQLLFSDPHGPVTLTFDGADDEFAGDADTNLLVGSGGDDTLAGLGGDDTFFGVDGADRYDGGAGVDTLDVTDRTDAVTVRLSAGTFASGDGDTAVLIDIENVSTGAGDDWVYGDMAANTVRGGDGDDVVYGDAGADVIDGGSGADILSGGQHSDRIDGGAGGDRIYGGGYDDVANGGAGMDVIIGDSGADILNGGADGDRLYGGSGDDVLNGDAGADFLDGSGGADTYDGGAGNDRLASRLDGAQDTFNFEVGAGADRIYRYEEGVDRIGLSSDFGFADGADAIASMTAAILYSGGHAVLNLNGTDVIQLMGFSTDNPGATIADLADDIYIF